MYNDYRLDGSYSIVDLLRIIEILRGDNGCPWDREQDHHSIRNNFLEETYEVLDAIDRDDVENLREELGDVLLQVVFHSRMEEEAGRFGFKDVCGRICKKLILRHPHVFGDVRAETSAEVLNNWDEIKKKEKGQDTFTDTLNSVPRAFPALMRAAKVQKRAAKAGFDWADCAGAMDKLEEEMAELEAARTDGSAEETLEEMGDLLFSMVNVSRFLHCDPEEALTKATDKFIRRFAKVERLAAEKGLDMRSASMTELDKLWEQAKQC